MWHILVLKKYFIELEYYDYISSSFQSIHTQKAFSCATNIVFKFLDMFLVDEVSIFITYT